MGAAGEILAANITRVRTAQRLTIAEMSRLMTKIGRPIPELGLRRIEKGERRVDFDDLLALCHVLQICPVDLMVPKDAHGDPYPVTPEDEYTAESVREWIRGENLHLQRYYPPPDPAPPGILGRLVSPGTIMTEALDWMPDERARRVALDFYGPDGPYDDLNDPEGRHSR